ncbi:MAG: hypothetical protein ABFR36_05320 [Acidobacteriota bacterium]
MTEKKIFQNFKKVLIFLIPLILITLLILFLNNRNEKNWEIDEITFKARDGFELSAFLLKPVNPGKKKYPAVACFHQLSGNRDDFLKLFPMFAGKGIIAIAPNYVRQRANLSSTRITDLKDTLKYLSTLEYSEKGKTGIITASFTVETGMYAIQNNPDVIANVIISGPILREESRKWLTRNTNLAIFNIASILDGNHYLLMEEYTQRSLNPLSRNLFIKKKEAPFTLPAHGTFVFDELPEVQSHIADFFAEVFGIKEEADGVVTNPVPENMITFYSTDNMPINATFRKPEGRSGVPAILVYPPESETRLYYDDLAKTLVDRGFAVLAPNTKRACRKKIKINLCDMEVNGALNFLKSDKDIDEERIAVLFPGFYHYFAVKAVNNVELPVKLILLMNFEKHKRFLDMERSRAENGPAVRFMRSTEQQKILFYLTKYLKK